MATYVSASEIGNYNLVSDIILNSQWNISTLGTLFHPLLIARVRSIHILLNSNEDTWIWLLTPSGKTMVSSSYRHLTRSHHSNTPWAGWKTIWHMNVAPKIKIFIWKLCWNRLPTSNYISNIIHCQQTPYHICHFHLDFAKHILFDFSFAWFFWNFLQSKIDFSVHFLPSWFSRDWLSEGHNLDKNIFFAS